ncbi:unnamed protein product [Mytilus coruscus]|uniref:CCHC-type domain-containing protein n=1 Tax=Mytilus coruscus TaxID=42192 RepID=A0A6J8ACK8_MYTCO|nr:unnamed protein product [Mytilus coruscus]
MSDSEKLLDSDHESLPGPSAHSLPDGSSAHHTGNNDLVDTFSLFKTYLDGEIATLHKDLAVGNENFATKLKQGVSVKLKGEGNQIQFNFNCEIMADLVELQKRIPDEDAACLKLVSGAILKVKKRNKLIHIANKSPAGWKTIREYESNDLVSDSEDEKRIRSAESRDIRSIKEKKRPHPYRTVTATVSAPPAPMPNQHNVRQNNYQQPPFRTSRRREPSSHDICYNCNQLGHWRTQCPLFSTKPAVPGTSRQQMLAFGLSSAPYLFTKCLRPIVKYWRENGVDIVLYLDDGLGMGKNKQEASECSSFVKTSLLEAGFLINMDKSIFEPVQCLEWLGLVWDSSDFSISISDRRIDNTVTSLVDILNNFPNFTARKLAQITGKEEISAKLKTILYQTTDTKFKAGTLPLYAYLKETQSVETDTIDFEKLLIDEKEIGEQASNIIFPTGTLLLLSVEVWNLINKKERRICDIIIFYTTT